MLDLSTGKKKIVSVSEHLKILLFEAERCLCKDLN